MIDVLPGLPSNVIGFKATGEVTKDDYEKVVFPGIRKHTDASRELNFVFFVDTPLKNFSPGAWIRDIWLQVKKLAAWHKVAIISDVETVRRFTDTISHLLPGEYKGFLSAQLDEAVRWAATDEKRAEKHSVGEEPPAYIESLLPPQVKGDSKGVTTSVMAGNEEDARLIFERAGERLLDVNNWIEHCNPLSTALQLTDDSGEPLQGTATEGDFIQIDVPRSSPREDKEHDWVRIEKIVLHTATPGIPGNLFLVQVRPSPDPQIKGSVRIAHFMEDTATSTFIVALEGRKVTAMIFGRNEVANTSDAGSADKLRNGIAGTIGAAGLSRTQWKDLVEGLLE